MTGERAAAIAVAVGVALLAAAFAGILVLDLYVWFPTLTETGDASLQAWVGPAAARAGYAALVLVLAAGMAVAAGFGIVPAARMGWAGGVVAGLVSGLVAGLSVIWVDATADTLSQLQSHPLVVIAIVFFAPMAAGAWTALRSRTIEGGLLGGVWCGLLGTLLLVVISTAAFTFFSSRLEAGPWLADPRLAHVPGCAAAAGARLGACEIGDDLGGLVIQLLAAPLIGALLGGFGGAVALVLRPSPAGPPIPRQALTAAAGLCALFFVTLVVELTTKLW